jgi:hypothetical protein
MKILLRGMDYKNVQMVTVQMEIGPPRPGFVKVFDHLDQELMNVERLQLFLDDKSGLYELAFVHKGEERTATLVNLEPCNNTMT